MRVLFFATLEDKIAQVFVLASVKLRKRVKESGKMQVKRGIRLKKRKGMYELKKERVCISKKTMAMHTMIDGVVKSFRNLRC